MIPTISLPAGTLASDLDFSDKLTDVNGRIAFHESRLNLIQSEPSEDIAQANLVLSALAASRSPDEVEERVRARTGLWYDVVRQSAIPPTPESVVSPLVASTPLPIPTLPVPPATGYRRIAQAFAAEQPVSRQSTIVPSNGGPTGVLRLAAYYSQLSKTNPTP